MQRGVRFYDTRHKTRGQRIFFLHLDRLLACCLVACIFFLFSFFVSVVVRGAASREGGSRFGHHGSLGVCWTLCVCRVRAGRVRVRVLTGVAGHQVVWWQRWSSRHRDNKTCPPCRCVPGLCLHVTL